MEDDLSDEVTLDNGAHLYIVVLIVYIYIHSYSTMNQLCNNECWPVFVLD